MSRPLAALFVLLLVATCATEPQVVEGGVVLVTELPDDPTGEAAGRFDFGRVGRRGSAAMPLVLRNESESTQTVLLWMGGDGSFHAPSQLELAPGETAHAAVVLRPWALGPAAGLLTIEIPDTPAITVALEGEVVSACTAASALVIGDTFEGCGSDVGTVIVENGCDHPLRLVAIAAESDAFLMASQPVLPRRLEAGEAITLGVKHTPHHALPSEAELVVTDDAGAELLISLRATGLERARTTEVLRQGERADADRLYVIDDSAAMAPHAAALAAWAEAVEADLGTIDARVGVTTTSRLDTDGCPLPAAHGRLLPVDGSRMRVLDWFELADGRLVDRLALPFCSRAPNEAFAAAERAVLLTALRNDPDSPEANDGNLGLRRADVPLQVVFVAASDDASGDLDSWLRRFDELQRMSNVTFSAILTGAACERIPSSNRIALLVRAFGGEVHHLCSETQGGPWDAIHHTPPFALRFPLSDTPFDRNDDGAILEEDDGFAVHVDGVHLPQTGPGGVLRYRVLPQVPAVEFEPAFAPEEDQTIEFAYLPVCW